MKNIINRLVDMKLKRTFRLLVISSLCSFVILVISAETVAQNSGTGIGIGTTDVHESAILQIKSQTNTQGVLFPRMNAAQRGNVAPTAEDGLIVYDDVEHVHYQWNEGYGAWEALVPIPRGIIVMWSGTTSRIPDGWFLCNGENGTPDLRRRFIVGYDPDNPTYNQPGSYSEGTNNTSLPTFLYDDGVAADRGGSERVTLTTGQMPAHDHGGRTGEDGDHTHSITDPGHFHQQRVHQRRRVGSRDENRTTVNADVFDNVPPNGNAVNTFRKTTGISIRTNGDHRHTINSQGSGTAHENRPPYYTLAFIMKALP